MKDLHEIIEGCKRNDRSSQEKLYRQFYPGLYALCKKFFSDNHDALTSLNNGMLNVFKNIGKYDPAKGELFNWAYTIVRNAAITHLNSMRILQPTTEITDQIVGKGKFVFDIRTGPVIGILISHKQVSGSTSGPENGEIVSTVNSDYTRLKISWQWHLMLQLRWNFNDRLSFTISPSGIYYLNNLYDRNNKPPNIPFGIGVNVGLIYKFK